jgi:WD40 repeat protein
MRLRHDKDGSAAFSPEGKVIATSGGGLLRLWEARTGKLVRQITAKESNLHGRLLFSPDGKWLACQEMSSVCLIDPDTGRIQQRLAGTGDVLAFSPDSQLIATRLEKGTVMVWNTTTARPVRRLQGHEKEVGCASFTKDGRILVTCSWDRKLCRWDVATGTLQKTETLPLRLWRALSLSPDARLLAVVPYRREAVQLWDTETGMKRCTLQGEPACARGLAFAPNGQTLATYWVEEDPSENGIISLWDTATGRLLRRFPAPNSAMHSLQFAPDGRTLLSSDNLFVFLWDAPTGQRRLHYPAHEGAVQSLAFTPDGRTLVSGSRDGTLRLWDAVTGRPGHMLAGHRGGVNAVAVLPDGRSVLSAGADGTLLVWDLTAGKELRRLTSAARPPETVKTANPILRLGLSADGSSAVSYSSGSSEDPRPFLHIWDLPSAKALVRRSAETEQQEVQLFSPDLRTYLTYVDKAALSLVKSLEKVPPPGTISAVLKEVATGRQILALPQPDHGCTPQAFSPDGRLLITVTFRRSFEKNEFRYDRHRVHFWELATGKERLTIMGPETGQGYSVQRLALSPDSRTLATARRDGIIQLWEVATGKELQYRTGAEMDARPQAQATDVGCLAFAPDGQALAVGYADSTILLWDLSSQARRRASPPVPAQDLEAWWADLAADDARKAHAAIWSLIDVPRQAIPLLRTRLSPAARFPEGKLRRLLEDLDSDQYADRESASRELAELGESAFDALQKALRADPSPEQRRRIEDLLNAAPVVRSSTTMRCLRAIEVLEYIGTAEAMEVIEILSRGAPEARLSKEARASLARLVRTRK